MNYLIWIVVVVVIVCLAVICFLMGIMHERGEWFAMLKQQQEEVDKKRRWITTKIPDGIYGNNNLFKDCTISQPMPDDYFDEDGVY